MTLTAWHLVPRCLVAGACLIALACVLPGCAGPDNPKIADAPPPPAPKPEEITPPNLSKAKAKYGAGSKYQKAMDRLNKAN